MLADQVRCSSGFTEVRGGVIRVGGTAQSATAAPNPPEAPQDKMMPHRTRRVLQVLRALAADGKALPRPGQLAGLIGPEWNIVELLAALGELEARRRIAVVKGRRDQGPIWWAIRLLDVGAVLRTENCPPEVQP